METISVLCLTATIEDHQPPALKPGPSRVYPQVSYRDTSGGASWGLWTCQTRFLEEKLLDKTNNIITTLLLQSILCFTDVDLSICQRKNR